MSYFDLPRLLRDFLTFLPLLSFLFFSSSFIFGCSRRKGRALVLVFSSFFSSLSVFSVYLHLCADHKEGFALALLSSFPAWLLVSLDFALFLGGAAFFFYLAKAKRSLLSLSSYQDAYDALPLGVCFFDTEGRTLLLNRFLMDFSDRYMSYYLMNAKEFIARLKQGEWAGKSVPFEGGEAYKSDDGEVFVLSLKEHSLHGKRVSELILHNVTELYELTLATKQSNEELRKSNERLKALGKEIASLRKEEENLLAKKRIHDDLGGLLLYAKSCLDKDLGEEEKEALLLYLEKQAHEALSLEKKEIGEGLFEDLKKAGEDIGVKVFFSGDPIPQNEEKFVYEAVRECLLNAYRHGKATCLETTYIKKEVGHELIISNNGRLKEGEVKEGTGLEALHRLVENKGGSMAISTSPKFTVAIRMGKL